jgi:nitrite reductase/ring-hydroxylating ferredoxin subunit
MMSGRQAQLDAIKNGAPIAPAPRRVLGSLDEVRSRLPITIEERGRRFRIVEFEGKPLAHTTVCPHTLGPLGNAAINNGIIECPWHGYRFDVVTRRCVSGQKCSLAAAPQISVDALNSNVIVEWKSDQT